MNLTVYGGTGPAGVLLIEQAVAAGHGVTAYVRTPSKLQGDPRLTVVEGQLDDPERVAAAVDGADAVISLLGPTKPYRAEDVPVLTEAPRVIVAAMRDHQVGRLVALSTPSVHDPADRREYLLDLSIRMSRRFWPVAYDAFVQMGEVVRGSDLEWTLVRVPLLTNGPRTQHVAVRMLGGKGGMRVSRANAAAFLLEQATDASHIGEAPIISDR
ncbi:MAG: NAD(P)-dependent oxidoreductase [Acidimicrobiales bacterium]